jgi:UDP-N-acetylmuramoylalanine--D-glutamate ligase
MTLDPPARDRIYVVECSSYQIDLAPSMDPTAGVLLNITPDHLDRHGTIQHYADVKERLVAGSRTAVVGVDDIYCAQIADRLERAGREVVRISKRLALADGMFAEGSTIVKAWSGRMQPVVSLEGIGSLRGQHNAQNAIAATAACLDIGLTLDEIQAGLRSFPGLAHRMEQVGRLGRVLFINDSKATNPASTAPALAAFPPVPGPSGPRKRLHWIVGGLPKGDDLDDCAPYFGNIAAAYTIGDAGPAFAELLQPHMPVMRSEMMAQAIREAIAAAKPGDIVMLSPACASFDQFRDYEARGDAFRQIVAALTEPDAAGEEGV